MTYSVHLVYLSKKNTVSVGKEVFWVIKKVPHQLGFKTLTSFLNAFDRKGNFFLFFYFYWRIFYYYFLFQDTFFKKKSKIPKNKDNKNPPILTKSLTGGTSLKTATLFSVQCSREVHNCGNHASFMKWVMRKEHAQGPDFTNGSGPNQSSVAPR